MRELRNLVQQQQHKMGEMQTELTEHKLQINEQKRELQLLKVKQTISILSKQTKYLVKMLPWKLFL